MAERRVATRCAAEVTDAAARGFATSHDEVIPSLRAVAVPLVVRGRGPAAIAVVFVASAHTDEEIAARLARVGDGDPRRARRLSLLRSLSRLQSLSRLGR